MKNILLSLLILFPIALHGQCEYLSKKVDDFTGDKNVTLMPRSVYIHKDKSEIVKVNFLLMANEGKKYIGTIIAHTNDRPKCLSSDSKLLIKKSDGTIVELFGEEQFSCGNSNGTVTSVVGLFSIDDSQLNELKDGVDKFRISFSNTLLDGEFGEIGKSYGLGMSGPDNYDSKFYFKDMIPCLESGIAEL
jgi:hypothetical protein